MLANDGRREIAQRRLRTDDAPAQHARPGLLGSKYPAQVPQGAVVRVERPHAHDATHARLKPLNRAPLRSGYALFVLSVSKVSETNERRWEFPRCARLAFPGNMSASNATAAATEVEALDSEASAG